MHYYNYYCYDEYSSYLHLGFPVSVEVAADFTCSYTPSRSTTAISRNGCRSGYVLIMKSTLDTVSAHGCESEPSFFFICCGCDDSAILDKVMTQNEPWTSSCVSAKLEVCIYRGSQNSILTNNNPHH